jgi:hypothetical protein
MDWQRGPRSYWPMKGLTFFRIHSNLHPGVRLQLHIERDDLLTQLAALDHTINNHARQRRQMITHLDDLREQLWPRMQRVHPARPPNHNQPPIPPAQPDALPLHGRHLRWICLALLARNGPLTLTELHTLIHAHGYTLTHPHRIKTLADALGYETRLGRCRRIQRGTYQLHEQFRPRPGRHGHPTILDNQPNQPQPHTDPHTRHDPDQWPEHPGFPDPDPGPGPDPGPHYPLDFGGSGREAGATGDSILIRSHYGRVRLACPRCPKAPPHPEPTSTPRPRSVCTLTGSATRRGAAAWWRCSGMPTGP